MTKVITNRAPAFLKEAYKLDADLVNHAGFIEPMQYFIEWDGDWMVYLMTVERVPRLCGRYRTLTQALFHAEK